MATTSTNSPRKRRGKRAIAKSVTEVAELTPFEPMAAPKGLEIDLPTPEVAMDTGGIEINPETGAVTIEHDDGSITIDPSGETLRELEGADEEDTEHDANLALKIDSVELGRIAEELEHFIDRSGHPDRLFQHERHTI